MTEHPYSRLTPDVVIRAAEELGYEPDARIFGLNSYENRVYQVGIEESDPVIVKFYRPERWTMDQIIEEHGFTQQLYELDIPVVPPLPRPIARSRQLSALTTPSFPLPRPWSFPLPLVIGARLPAATSPRPRQRSHH